LARRCCAVDGLWRIAKSEEEEEYWSVREEEGLKARRGQQRSVTICQRARNTVLIADTVT
jgi:hypothetical protein